jgi:ribosomal protein L37AE/L43A
MPTLRMEMTMEREPMENESDPTAKPRRCWECRAGTLERSDATGLLVCGNCGTEWIDGETR